MQIQFHKTQGLLIHFPLTELELARTVLRNLYATTKAQIIMDLIKTINLYLQPKLTLVSHFHFCHNCQMEIDDRVGDNFIHYTSDTDDKWFHRYCKPLKEDRP